MDKTLNVLGTTLEICGMDPVTGWRRDGCCHTDITDHGVHTVCCVVSQDFLEFSKKSGNDLTTPIPDFGFPGLRPGDRWCLCAGRWLEAYKANKACPVDLSATHEETLAIIPLKFLKEYDIRIL